MYSQRLYWYSKGAKKKTQSYTLCAKYTLVVYNWLWHYTNLKFYRAQVHYQSPRYSLSVKRSSIKQQTWYLFFQYHFSEIRLFSLYRKMTSYAFLYLQLPNSILANPHIKQTTEIKDMSSWKDDLPWKFRY